MIIIFSSTEFYIDHILPGVQEHDPNYSANLELHVERFRTVYKNEGIVPRFVEYCLPKLEGHCRSKWIRLFSFSANRTFLRLRRSLPAGSLVDARLLAGGYWLLTG